MMITVLLSLSSDAGLVELINNEMSGTLTQHDGGPVLWHWPWLAYYVWGGSPGALVAGSLTSFGARN